MGVHVLWNDAMLEGRVLIKGIPVTWTVPTCLPSNYMEVAAQRCTECDVSISAVVAYPTILQAIVRSSVPFIDMVSLFRSYRTSGSKVVVM